MEEYSTDEEEEEEQTAKKEVISVDPVCYWHSKSRLTTISQVFQGFLSPQFEFLSPTAEVYSFLVNTVDQQVKIQN